MKTVLIIGGLPNNEERPRVFKEYAEGVQRVLGTDFNVKFTHIGNLQIVMGTNRFDIYDTANNVSLTDVDMISLHAQVRHFVEMAYTISRFCAYHKIPYFNDFSAYFPGNKVGQAVLFVEAGVRIPKTLYALDTDQYLRLIAKELGFPFILKDAVGTKGQSNYLVNSLEEAREHFKNEPAIRFIAQEYCPNDHDYRVLLTPKRMLAFERRGGADTHLNNTSKGATAALATGAIPTDVTEAARRIVAKLGLSFSGVDVMPHVETGEFYFLEINSQPQLFTGALLDEKEVFVRDLYLDVLQDV